MKRFSMLLALVLPLMGMSCGFLEGLIGPVAYKTDTSPKPAEQIPTSR